MSLMTSLANTKIKTQEYEAVENKMVRVRKVNLQDGDDKVTIFVNFTGNVAPITFTLKSEDDKAFSVMDINLRKLSEYAQLQSESYPEYVDLVEYVGMARKFDTFADKVNGFVDAFTKASELEVDLEVDSELNGNYYQTQII